MKVAEREEEESVSGREMGVAVGMEGDREIGNAWSFFLLYLFGCPAVFNEYSAKNRQ
jgi:hypothetical protein